ncbi:MAG: hypothetical protein D4R67_03370 [Bacteroidetes bacterium]|nr:MAG: hypothetical protein D4R67_03370 [Bacteroidota bacterium]
MFTSLPVVVLFLTGSCCYNNQAISETTEEDSIGFPTPDSIPVGTADTTLVVPEDTTLVVTGDTLHAMVAQGDSVTVRSTRVESTEPGTVSRNPGAVKHQGPEQAQTDSIKKDKTKEKKKN